VPLFIGQVAGEVSSHLGGQNRVVKKMKTNGPAPALIALAKTAANEIANHGQESIEVLFLRGHLRFVTSSDQHVFILFDLKHELFLHHEILPHKTRSGKRTLLCPRPGMPSLQKDLYVLKPTM
jgi:hypothetical protein